MYCAEPGHEYRSNTCRSNTSTTEPTAHISTVYWNSQFDTVTFHYFLPFDLQFCQLDYILAASYAYLSDSNSPCGRLSGCVNSELRQIRALLKCVLLIHKLCLLCTSCHVLVFAFFRSKPPQSAMREWNISSTNKGSHNLCCALKWEAVKWPLETV